MQCIYPVILTPNGHGYLAKAPDVPGCVTDGVSLSEAIAMVRDALCACLCVYEDEGIALPAPRLPEEIAVSAPSVCALIEVDTLAYRAKTDTRCVRKNVSLPAWLSDLADKRHVNCSQVLRQALLDRFGGQGI